MWFAIAHSDKSQKARRTRVLPSQAELSLRLRYDRETGVLTWAKSGAAAGGIHRGNGYLQLRFNGERFLAHRLIFVLMTGREPIADVDHKNGIRHDNRWDNLREASRGQNCENKKTRCDNVLGVKGVHAAKSGAFDARIFHRGRHVHLGRFRHVNDAISAYRRAAGELQGEFAFHRRGEA